MEQAPAFDELKPIGELVLAKDGEYYAMYCRSAGKKSIALAGNRPYNVEVLDPWEMTATARGHGKPGFIRLYPGEGGLDLSIHSTVTITPVPPAIAGSAQS